MTLSPISTGGETDDARRLTSAEIAAYWGAKRLLRMRVMAAFDYRCEYCGHHEPDAIMFGKWSLWQVDRIVPGCRGGAYAPDNVTLACRRCNQAKQARDYIGPVRSLAVLENVSSTVGEGT